MYSNSAEDIHGAKSGSGNYFCNFVHSCPLQCHDVACLDASLDLMLVILQANPCSFWGDLQPEQGQAQKAAEDSWNFV